MRCLAVFLALVALALSQTTEWQSVYPSLSLPASDLTATAVSDGIILAGGCISPVICAGVDCTCSVITSTINKWIPSGSNTGTFTALTPMPRARFRHNAVLVGTQIWFFGGRDLNDTIIPEVDIFDTASATWSVGPVFDAADLVSDGAAFYLDGLIHVVGGYDQSYTAVDKTLTLDTTSLPLAWTVSDEVLNTPRGDLCAATIQDLAYIYGGFSDDFCSPIGDPETYSSVNGWNELAPLETQQERGDKACVALDGKFYVIGGETKEADISGCYSVPVADVEAYDPVNETWSIEASISVRGARFRFAAAAFDGSVYIFGGQSSRQSGSIYPVVGTIEVLVDVESSSVSSEEDGPSPFAGVGEYFLVLIILIAVLVCCSITVIVAFVACPQKRLSAEESVLMQEL